jgi:predicted transcriptional regulator
MVLSLKEFISAMTDKKAIGSPITFTPFHIYCALEQLSQSPIGRDKLADNIDVGKGTIRTILTRLKKVELISNNKKNGCALTQKGQEVWQQFEQVFPQKTEISKTEITTSEFNYAFRVKNQKNKIMSGIEQRDAAIIAGARRAIVLITDQKGLHIASTDQYIEEQYEEASREILKKISPQNNDVIIIAGAETSLRAKNGAFAAAWDLLDP